MGGVSWYKLVAYILLSAKRRAYFLQKYRDRNGRCIAILFKSIGVRGQCVSICFSGVAGYILPNLPTSQPSGGCWTTILSFHSLQLKSWKKGSPLPIPPPKRVRSFDAMPPTPLGPTFRPVCKEDLGSVAALGAHYNSFHAIRDNCLATKPSFQCSRCDSVSHSK